MLYSTCDRSFTTMRSTWTVPVIDWTLSASPRCPRTLNALIASMYFGVVINRRRRISSGDAAETNCLPYEIIGCQSERAGDFKFVLSDPLGSPVHRVTCRQWRTRSTKGSGWFLPSVTVLQSYYPCASAGASGLVGEYRTRNFHVAGTNLAQAICKQPWASC